MENINGRRTNQLIRKSDVHQNYSVKRSDQWKRTNYSIQLLKFRRNSMNALDWIFYIFTREWKGARETCLKMVTLCQIFRPARLHNLTRFTFSGILLPLVTQCRVTDHARQKKKRSFRAQFANSSVWIFHREIVTTNKLWLCFYLRHDLWFFYAWSNF